MNKKLLWLLLLANVCVLLPILYLSMYDYPAADDFSYAMNPHNLDFMQREFLAYQTWTSRYFATGVLITSPLNFGTDTYFGIYTLAFSALFYLCLANILSNIKFHNKWERRLFALSLMSAYTLIVPSVVDNYFWLAGSATYFLPCIFFVFYFACLIRISANRNNWKDLLMGFFSIFVMGGSVEIIVGFAGILTLIFAIYYFIKNKRVSWEYYVFMLLILAETIFIVVSPGNKIRSGALGLHLDFGSALLMSAKKVLTINIRYLLYAIVLFLILFKLFRPKLIMANYFSKPLSLFIFYNFLLFIGSFITIYSLKYIYPLRVENALTFISLVFVFLISYLVYEKYLQRFPLKYYLGGLCAAACVYFLSEKNSVQRQNNLALVYTDIFSGKAAGYHRQIEQRKKILKSCSDCEVPLIQNPPASIMIKDLQPNFDHFINKDIAYFFKVKSISVKK